MRSVEEQLAVITGLVSRLPTETVSLEHASGRVTGTAITASGSIPPFDNSAMDGYAVRTVDLARATPAVPVRLSIVGEAFAGHPAQAVVGPGTAVRIMTGAPVPRGADAVVAQEKVAVSSGAVAFTAAVQEGANIRRAGEDARPGDVVVAAGVRLRARHLAAAAAAGVPEMRVVRRPRIGILVTGDELVPPGTPLRPGQIHESNGTYLAAALPALGAEPVPLGPVRDDAHAVRDAVATSGVDLVVTTGGASVGDRDPVKEGLAPAGVEFVRVAMQPGKPQGAGTVGGTPVLCFPGNPVAVAVCTEVFLVAVVAAMTGAETPPWGDRIVEAGWRCPAGRAQFMPVTDADGALRPATARGSQSHLIARLASADGIAWVDAEVEEVVPGMAVRYRRFTA